MKLNSIILTALFLHLVYLLGAQFQIQGKVIDKESKKPLAGVSVFLSGTTIGTMTNEAGVFQLGHLTSPKYELVVSSINYESYIVSVPIKENKDTLVIFLTPTAHLLQEVVVEPYDKDGWKRWGEKFKSFFIGGPQSGKHCKLINPDVVKFRFNSSRNKLRAFATEKLVFENVDLGYRIKYLLSTFELDFINNVFTVKGYPLFEELSAKDMKESSKWKRLRAAAYNGSIKHFIRSLYQNQIASNGFEIRSLKLITSEETDRVNVILKRYDEAEDLAGVKNMAMNKDSLDYYLKVRNIGSDTNLLVLNGIIPRDSIVFDIGNPEVMELNFKGLLQVTYLRKKNPMNYALLLPANKANEFVKSVLHLRTADPVYIFSNGSYYNGLDLITDGYWAWFEKISTMLPLDYQPIQ